MVYRSFFENLDARFLTTGIMLMSLFLLAGIVNHDFSYTFYIVSIGYHLSAFLMTLAALIFLIRFLRKNRFSALVILFIISVVAIINDRLFMAIFSIPVFALGILLFRNTPYRAGLYKILATNVLSIGVALPLFTLLRFNSPIRIMGLSWRIFSFDQIVPSLAMFSEQHSFYLSQYDFRALIDLLFLLSLILHSTFLVRKLISFFKNEDVPMAELIYLLLFVVITVSTVVMPIINGSYSGWDILRYNVYSLYFGIFSFGYLLYKLSEVLPGRRTVMFIVPAVLLLSGTVFVYHEFRKENIKAGMNELLHYYPEKVACMDRLAREHSLKNGVGNYWDGKLISMFSKEGLRIFSVYTDLKPYYHVMNENWYYVEDGSKKTSREFTFIIKDDIAEETIKNLLGEPLDTFTCKENELIEVFKPFRYNRVSHLPFYPETGSANP